jgi:hypothetical protein
MGVHHILDNGKAQPGAGDVPGLRVLDPIELIKNLGKFLRRDAHPCIRYLNLHLAAEALCRDVDLPAFRRIVDGVGNEVAQDLFHSLGIC